MPAKSELPGAEINLFRQKECSEMIHYTPTFELEPFIFVCVREFTQDCRFGNEERVSAQKRGVSE